MYPTNIYAMKMLPNCCIRCIYSKALQNVLILEANTMNPDRLLIASAAYSNELQNIFYQGSKHYEP